MQTQCAHCFRIVDSETKGTEYATPTGAGWDITCPHCGRVTHVPLIVSFTRPYDPIESEYVRNLKAVAVSLDDVVYGDINGKIISRTEYESLRVTDHVLHKVYPGGRAERLIPTPSIGYKSGDAQRALAEARDALRDLEGPRG